jgi:hypothetical protein
MNKLLTTIILLCFSVAANADIYFCTVEKTVDIDELGTSIRDENKEIRIEDEFNSTSPTISESAISEQQTFIVDTAKGLKEIWRSRDITQEGDYTGNCKTVADNSFEYISCEIELTGVLKNFVLSLRNNSFSHSTNMGGIIINHLGTCTKA